MILSRALTLILSRDSSCSVFDRCMYVFLLVHAPCIMSLLLALCGCPFGGYFCMYVRVYAHTYGCMAHTYSGGLMFKPIWLASTNISGWQVSSYQKVQPLPVTCTFGYCQDRKTANQVTK
jgi:hypothetical protein